MSKKIHNMKLKKKTKLASKIKNKHKYKIKKQVIKKPSKQRAFYAPLSLNTLKKNQNYLHALNSASTPRERIAFLRHMQPKDFQFVCRCVNDIIHNQGQAKGLLNTDQIERLSHALRPHKHNLKAIINKHNSLANKQKLATGGRQVSKIGNIISSMLPLMSHALSNNRK